MNYKEFMSMINDLESVLGLLEAEANEEYAGPLYDSLNEAIKTVNTARAVLLMLLNKITIC